jgi:hypothetical protein
MSIDWDPTHPTTHPGALCVGVLVIAAAPVGMPGK